MKIKVFSDEGAIEGWFVAFCTTVLTYGLIVVAFFGGVKYQTALKEVGGVLQTVYPLTFGSWLAYKAVKSVAGRKEGGVSEDCRPGQ